MDARRLCVNIVFFLSFGTTGTSKVGRKPRQASPRRPFRTRLYSSHTCTAGSVPEEVRVTQGTPGETHPLLLAGPPPPPPDDDHTMQPVGTNGAGGCYIPQTALHRLLGHLLHVTEHLLPLALACCFHKPMVLALDP